MRASTRKTATTKAKKAPPAAKPKPAPARTATFGRAVKAYEDAVRAYGKHEYSRAVHLFEAVIKEFPSEREICDRARVHLSACRARMAPAAPKPKGADDYYYLGVVAGNDGRLQEAAELYEKALKQDSGSDKIHYALAGVLSQMNARGRALASLARAVELNAANRVHALNDTDFDALRDDAEFLALVGLRPERGT